MTSPAVAAIQSIARNHVAASLSLSDQLVALKQMYREQDWMWIETMKDLERRIAEEQQAGREALRDAREIAQEERTR